MLTANSSTGGPVAWSPALPCPCAFHHPAVWPRAPVVCSFGPANDTVYAALLTLIQRQAIQERAVDVWTAVREDGVRQSPHLLSALFAGAGRCSVAVVVRSELWLILAGDGWGTCCGVYSTLLASLASHLDAARMGLYA